MTGGKPPIPPPTQPSECPDGPHRFPQGPNEDVAQCPTCWGISHRMRPADETYGGHLADCSLPRNHASHCQPGGNGHPRAEVIRGHWRGTYLDGDLTGLAKLSAFIREHHETNRFAGHIIRVHPDALDIIRTTAVPAPARPAWQMAPFTPTLDLVRDEGLPVGGWALVKVDYAGAPEPEVVRRVETVVAASAVDLPGESVEAAAHRRAEMLHYVVRQSVNQEGDAS